MGGKAPLLSRGIFLRLKFTAERSDSRNVVMVEIAVNALVWWGLSEEVCMLRAVVPVESEVVVERRERERLLWIGWRERCGREGDEMEEGFLNWARTGGALMDLEGLYGAPEGGVEWFFRDRGGIERWREAVREGQEVVSRRLVREMYSVATADIGGAYRDGRLLPVEEWPEGLRRGIRSFEVREEEVDGVVNRTMRFQLMDKLRAAQMLGNELGVMTTRVKVEASDSLAAVLGRTLAGPADGGSGVLDAEVVPESPEKEASG